MLAPGIQAREPPRSPPQSQSAVYTPLTQADENDGLSKDKWFTQYWKYGKEFDTFKMEVDTHTLFLQRVCLANGREQLGDSDSDWLHRMNVGYAMFLQFVNFVLQIGITFVLTLDVEHKEDAVETATFEREFNMSLAEAVSVLRQVPGGYGEEADTSIVPAYIMDKCEIQTGNGLRHLSFYHLMSFVWVGKMIEEVVKCVLIARRIWNIQTPKEEDEQKEGFSLFDKFNGDEKEWEESKDRSNTVIFLTNKLKILLIVTIPMLRLMIASGVAYAGMKFIMLQTSYGKVVLKALCMQWVITISGLLVKSFCSHHTLATLRTTSLHCTKGDQYWNARWQYGFGGIFLFSIGVAVVLLVNAVIFKDLMAFRAECLRVTTIGYKGGALGQLKSEIVQILN